MEGQSFIGLLCLLLSLTSVAIKCYSSSKDDLKTYIIYTGNTIDDEAHSLFLHENMLQQVINRNSTPRSILRHYTRSLSGFVAKLTEEEAERMAGLDGVVSLFPDEKRQPLTTRSWDFIGLPQAVERAYSESEIIIGMIDYGIWPESLSFSDTGYGPPPSKWKGTCEATTDFTCNNKIIGARVYISGFFDDSMGRNILSPRDTDGHGTHTSSIAAGNPIDMASLLGFGQGTTRGGASTARISVYKACWYDGCNEMDLLAAFDDAISDGVDILSVSIGAEASADIYFGDALSIGAFHAMKNGVLTVFGAGNSGPYRSSLKNLSPWSIAVAASTIDRKFVTKVILGNNQTFEGTSLNPFDLQGKLYPIIYSGDAPNITAGFNKKSSRNCSSGSLDAKLVKGKIVLCEQNLGAEEAFRVGAAGILMQGYLFEHVAQSYPLPACYLRPKDAAHIRKYIHSIRTPTASILKSNELKDDLAPRVASFSSRGPNPAIPEILKPDLTAPGVDILASWSPYHSISDVPADTRKFEFNMVSGTSMACPHVSGAAAFLKSYHSTWSPTAIRSALMTTATPMNPDRAAEFAYGAGQINPTKALNPGMIYEADEGDYISFLCGQGFNSSLLKVITGEHVNCSDIAHTTARDLNYPSFALKAPRPKRHVSGSFKRTVTNIGISTSTYKATVTAPKGLKITVTPGVLLFISLGEKKTFILTVEGVAKHSIQSASLIWDDGTHQVRSPIVVFDERAEKGNSVNLHCTNYLYIVLSCILFYIIIE